MLNRAAAFVMLVLIPLSAFAAPKGRESTSLQVVSSNTRIHRTASGTVFAYTDLMFIQAKGKKLVYECVLRGNICPLMESGKTYTADQDGAFIYISMNTPEDKKALSVKFKQVGSW
jgi:hypothetical protein